jgi:hypothetical protein
VSVRHCRRLLVIACVVLAAGCGKKGSPLPPLQRVPAPIKDMQVQRIDQDVYARFAVPATNIDGVAPADLARVELYAITSEDPATALLQRDLDDLRRAATLVASETVRRPLPAMPPLKEGAPPIPSPPLGPGVDQGAMVVFQERITPDLHAPVTVPGEAAEGDARERAPSDLAVQYPPVAPSEVTGPIRYYFAVGVSPRGRYSPPSALMPVPLGPTSSAPPLPTVTVDETKMTVRWTPAPDARGFTPPTPENLLPSRSLMPGLPPTTYDVYEVSKNGSPAGPSNTGPTMPTPLTPGPLGALEFTQTPITLGTERCFLVRPVDIVNGLHVRGPASPIACESFSDRFAPAPPSSLGSAATSGAINLIWEPSAATDVVGYVVLRGTGDAPLTPLMKDPVVGTTYTDSSVQAGVRYIYAVIAVDKAGNRSVESNRQEETARQ